VSADVVGNERSDVAAGMCSARVAASLGSTILRYKSLTDFADVRGVA
jgi:hypothetical protein